MPLRRLAAKERSPRRNRALGAVLAFVAGTVDVCGYLELGQFTSHVTGQTAALARGIADLHQFATPGAIVLSFVAGAAVSSLVIQWLQRRGWESEFAVPMLLEGALLVVMWGVASPAHQRLSLGLFAFTMGLQNAMITRLSHKEIRTTHITAMVTDIGIQLGRALYRNRSRHLEPVRTDRKHLATLLLLVTSFFMGGVVAGLGAPRFGFGLLLPLAGLLCALTVMPVLADVRRERQVAP